MGRRSEHRKSELQHLILEATTDLVEQVGVEGVTARMIADKIGYTPGMLYTAFDSLPDILINVNNNSLEILNNRCVGAASAAKTPREKLHAIATAYSDFAARHNHRFNMLFDHSVIRKQSSTVPFTETMGGTLNAIEKSLTSLSPQVPKDDIRTGALSVWSAIHGACFLGISNNWERPTPPSAESPAESNNVLQPANTEHHNTSAHENQTSYLNGAPSGNRDSKQGQNRVNNQGSTEDVGDNGTSSVLHNTISLFEAGWVQRHHSLR